MDALVANEGGRGSDQSGLLAEAITDGLVVDGVRFASKEVRVQGFDFDYIGRKVL